MFPLKKDATEYRLLTRDPVSTSVFEAREILKVAPDALAGLARAAFHDCYTNENLRYSQTVALGVYREKNSGTNLPAQIDIYATGGAGYQFLFVAKGSRSKQVTDACKKTAAFTSAPSAVPPRFLRRSTSKKVEVVGYPEPGMGAIWKIEVEDFPAFILVDDKGNDFFKTLPVHCEQCANGKGSWPGEP